MDRHRYCRKTIISILITLLGLLTGQSVPIDLDHPVNDYILRYTTEGIVQTLQQGMRPFSFNQINTALDEISKAELTQKEKNLLHYYEKEFDVNHFDKGIIDPWQVPHLLKFVKGSVSGYNPRENKLRLVTYQDDDLVLWTDWEEMPQMDFQDTIRRSFNQDRVTISGQWNHQLSFYSRYSLYRVGYHKSDPLPEEFKQGYILLEKNTDWLVWDVSEASVKWNNSLIDIELSKLPIYWGFSRHQSPILSGNVQPFTFFRLSKNYKRFRAESIIGSLMPFGDQILDIKHLAAHRFEFDFLNTLTLSFSEMVIYAGRNLELGYLLPINLYWSEEHSLGNRDNVLMAFDGFWKVKPGLSIYGTFFWDELSWFKIFTHWWGNKFVFQSGIHFTPFSNPKLPDFRVEYTASRPWVYTHKDSLLTYTSAGIGLGFPMGPNSQLISVEMNMWPTMKSFISINVSYLRRGSGLGSNPNDNYALRDRFIDDQTPFLLGKISEQLILGTSIRYRLSELIYMTGNFNSSSDNQYTGKFGLLMDF